MDKYLYPLPTHVANPDPYIYLSDNYIVLDTETTNIAYGSAIDPNNQLILTVSGKGMTGWQVDVGNELEVQDLIIRLYEADFLVIQNAKFDIQWLVRAGLDLTRIIVYDTMIGRYIQNGNQPFLPKNLDALAEIYGIPFKKDNLVSKMIKLGICPSLIPISWLTDYCIIDCKVLEAVFLQQRKELLEANLLPILYTRCLLTVVLSDIEFNGMCLDPKVVEEEYFSYVEKKVKLDTQMNDITGGINAASPNQVSDFLYYTLHFPIPQRGGKPIVNKKGYHPTGKDIVAGLKANTQKQKEFIELKGKLGQVTAALSKSLEFFYGVCKEQAGNIFYGEFNQCRTKTQRLSASGRPILFDLYKKPKSCQFQNLPRAFKKVFKARHKGWKILEADQAQLEFRVGGWCGKDKQILYDIVHDVDIHAFTASVLNDVPEEDVTKEQRQVAKADTFKPTFGGERGTKAQEKYYEAFKEKYHELTATQEGWTQEVLKTKQLTLPTGLVVYWPDTRMNSRGRINNKTKIYNLPIQYLATAEMVPIGVVYAWHRMKAANLKSFMINSVHDSYLTETPPEEVEICTYIAKYAMIDDTLKYMKDVYDIDFNIPLEVEVEVNTNWTKNYPENE